ncbi:MAG: DASS family sodium-coupled anion symporter [Thermodesulfobacteriota bacterium]|nr:DASS family sodium-coupled anion symporter [Thermodesulfobacteriota bacterium]
MAEEKKKATGYDKYVNWKLFAIPLILVTILMLIPTPKGMIDVGVEYSMGPKYVMNYFATGLFGKQTNDLSQWQVQLVRMMEAGVRKASFSQAGLMKRSAKWCKSNKIPTTPTHLKQAKDFAGGIPLEKFKKLMEDGYDLRVNKLAYDMLTDKEKKKATRAGFHVKAAVGIVIFVVLCFITEAIPLPMVAFCIGVFAMCSGIVTRKNVAMLYWSDATWFIMGSLMFAVAFVKTGVDKRMAMMMFGKLKKPSLKMVTFMIILVIAPLTMFMSDHALAAMFLPIGMLLYATSTAASGKDDPELAKMLMITIAMACNLGGSLAPSGAARNLIMMGYAEDMFGIGIGYGEWLVYMFPLLLFTIPVTWYMINFRFKPMAAHTDLSASMAYVKEDIAKKGGAWTREQKITVVIFLVMLFCWITEKYLILSLTGIRFGIGVIAVMGAIAYVFAGIANWRDYQTGVDWGVVWLYAGAIIFGRVLVMTGGAYWIARSFVSVLEPLGLGKGIGLLLSGNVITGLLTQLMADGPACAAVGPVTLSMAGIVHPGTTMIPFMAMGTSYASSLAYCLIIGTPPNAIVYASGYLEPKDYLRVGVILWFTNLMIFMLMSATYWRFLGWKGLVPF